MMNLYTEGRITKEEMRKIPTFRMSGVMDRIDEIKNDLISSRIAPEKA